MSVDCHVMPSAEVEQPVEVEHGHAQNFIIHTGNVRRCNHLQAFVNPTTQQEVLTALKCTMHCWNKYHQNDFVLQKEIIPHPKLMSSSDEPVAPPSSAPDALFVKVFVLKEYEPGLVQTALSSVLKAVGRKAVDRLVTELKGEDVTSASLMAAWVDQEELHHDGFAKELGVASLSYAQVTGILEKATAPISVLEVLEDELDDSAVDGKAQLLRDMSSANNIILAPNDDAGDILPAKAFQRVMTKVLRHESAFTPAGEVRRRGSSSTSSSGGEKLKVEWIPVWVARYTLVDQKSSVISKTGYAIGGRYFI